MGRCQGQTAKREQCKNMVKVGNYCYLHKSQDKKIDEKIEEGGPQRDIGKRQDIVNILAKRSVTKSVRDRQDVARILMGRNVVKKEESPKPFSHRIDIDVIPIIAESLPLKDLISF